MHVLRRGHACEGTKKSWFSLCTHGTLEAPRWPSPSQKGMMSSEMRSSAGIPAGKKRKVGGQSAGGLISEATFGHRGGEKVNMAFAERRKTDIFSRRRPLFGSRSVVTF